MIDRRPTLEQVAALARVSRGTVSRVVNGDAKVSARTREAVQRAIAELGYVPNRAARMLAARRTGTIALVMSEDRGRRFEEPYFGRIVSGIGSAIAAAGMTLALTFTQSDSGRGDLADALRTQRVDGVLLVSLLRDDPLPGLLARHGIPVVLGGRPHGPGAAGLDYVDADNRGGARRAVEYLVRQGRRRIATIAGPPETTVGADRLAGYREALSGGRELARHGDFSVSAGAREMERLLAVEPSLDAVFAASDNMACGALRVLEREGRRVPDDVAIVGFEDAGAELRPYPGLTTVHQPTEAMGRQSVELLLDRIHGRPVADTPVICETRLIVRESS
jgi:DNA-binding LacI/PurR family transcriptional regulator